MATGKEKAPEPSGAERRENFRVEDVLSLICRKIDPSRPHLAARILPGFTENSVLPDFAEDPPDESVNPHLWRMLVQINGRLGLIINKLNLKEQAVTKAEPKKVSLSVSGVRFSTPETYAPGELLEIKILLPLDPPSWIAVYGNVVRNLEGEDGQKDVAVRFQEMDEPVIEAINRFCLKRQREIIRKRREF